MKKATFLIIGLIIFLLLIPHWWAIGIPLSFYGFFVCETNREAFSNASIGSGMAWGLKFAWEYFAGGGILITKVTAMMGLGYPLLLMVLTLVLPILIGGLAGLSGFHLRRFFDNCR